MEYNGDIRMGTEDAVKRETNCHKCLIFSGLHMFHQVIFNFVFSKEGKNLNYSPWNALNCADSGVFPVRSGSR